MKDEKVKELVKDRYAKVARDDGSCSMCGCNDPDDISQQIGYTSAEMGSVPDGANLGLGCGNPTAISELKEGDVVLDLGSGAGFDAFLAARQVGSDGRIIGVDMTEDMIDKARYNAQKGGYDNVEFRLGDIESLPVTDGSIDVVISNCVINLAPNKMKVFSEAYRVLKDDGKMFISDIVLLKDLDESQRTDADLISACVGGAMLKDDYLKVITKAGLKYRIIKENSEISKQQYQGYPVQSLNLVIFK